MNGALTWRPFFFQAGLNLSDVTITNIWTANMPSGNNTIYTVPSGKRMLFIGSSCGSTNNNISSYTQVLTNGVYYRLSQATTITTNNGGTVPNLGLVLEQGESFVVNTSIVGLRGMFEFLLYPNTFSCFSPRIMTLANGDNTLYTAPSGTILQPISHAFTIGNQQISYQGFNNSGAQRTYKLYLVPPSSSPSVDNILVDSKTLADGTQFAATLQLVSIPAGYSFVVNTDSGATNQTWYLPGVTEVVP